MAKVHSGSWFGLPDVGATEWIQSKVAPTKSFSAQGGSNLFGQTPQAVNSTPVDYGQMRSFGEPSNPLGGAPPGGGAGGQVLGSSTGRGAGGGGFNYPTPEIFSPNQGMGGQPSEQDVINNEFNNFNKYLDSQDAGARSNFDETKGLYDKSKANAEGQYKAEKQMQSEGYKKQESLDLAKVRQLLSDLTQRNAGQIAIGGGGSIGEALAERFGRTAQSSMGNVMNTASAAIERTNQFYNTAVTKLQESYDANVLQAKQVLNENLGSIQQARLQSASAKQGASIDAWKNFYAQVNRAKVEAATFKAQYDMWKQQQDSASAATQGFDLSNKSAYNTGVQSSMNPISTSAIPRAANTVPQQQASNPYFNRFMGQEDEEQEPLYGQNAGFNNA